MARKKLTKKLESIGGWLLVVLVLLIISAISNSMLFIQKSAALLNQFKIGILISAILSLLYCLLIWITIFMIFNRRKIAVKLYIASLIAGTLFLIWYYLISWLIYYPDKIGQIMLNVVATLINLVISIAIAFYFLKSKRVKRTLVR